MGYGDVILSPPRIQRHPFVDTNIAIAKREPTSRARKDKKIDSPSSTLPTLQSLFPLSPRLSLCPSCHLTSSSFLSPPKAPIDKSSLVAKNQHPHLGILTPTSNSTVTQPSARNRASMAGESPLALARARIPHLHHAVLTATYKAQMISSQRPYPFDVAEESAHAGLGAGDVGVC